MLSSILVSGRHGVTAIERDTTQPFSISAHLSFDASTSLRSRSLKDTIDYHSIVALIQREVETTSFVLLESLTDHLMHVVAHAFPVTTLRIAVQKTRIASQPSLAIIRHYFSERHAVSVRSFEALHDELVSIGLASTPFLSSEELMHLRTAAEKETYTRQSTDAHYSGVREDLSYCQVDNESEIFRSVADKIARFLYELEHAIGGTLYDGTLTEKELFLQKYDKGSFGITPHRDEKSNRNLVCIIALKGSAVVATCDDRAGTNPHPVDTTAGSLILLRAPGYMGMSVRPLHFVSDVAEERIVLAVRFVRN